MYDIIIYQKKIRENLLKKSKIFFLKSFSLLSLLFVAFSCSNSQESKLVYTESNTIKQSVKDKEQDITWTLELEGERLSKVINRNSLVIGSDVPYNKEIFKISKNTSPVYPAAGDFGSLDTRNLSNAVKEKLNLFCQALNEEGYNGGEGVFSRKYIFNYVFFINDFEDGWKKNFSKVIPAPDKRITKWIFGEPFIGSEIMQIPVRFFSDYGTIDMTVFLNVNGNNEFYQITIDRWQKV